MNKSDKSRDKFMLKGSLAQKGYDWWWHSFTAYDEETNEEKAFFVEYFVINPALSNDEVILGQSKENQQNKKIPSYVMVKAGVWGAKAKQLHRFFPISAVGISRNKLELKAADCYLSETHMSGSIDVSEKDSVEHPEYMSDSGSMSWNIDIDKKISFNVGYGASKFFRAINAFEMFWHAEGIKTLYSGYITLDGRKYNIIKEKSYGYADKNWGKNFTSPWVWISSCNLYSKKTNKVLNNSVLEAGGGRPKIYFLPLNRKLLIEMNYEGEVFEYNFSKFWTGVHTVFNCYETDDKLVWNITTRNRKSELVIECFCNKSEMLLINYEAPDGTRKHDRLWNGGTGYGNIKLYKLNKYNRELIDDIEFKNAGCEYGEYRK